MTCTNPAHYPNREALLSLDPHLHCAGRVEVRDGRTVVVDPTPCEPTLRRCGVCGEVYDRSLDAHPEER